MRGHEHIVELRRRGVVPIGGVIVDASPLDASQQATDWGREWGKAGMSMAFVDIEPSETIDRLDLRFAIGLEVQVSGDDANRVREVAQAFVKAGARRVIAGAGGMVGEEWKSTVFMVGNREVMQWQT